MQDRDLYARILGIEAPWFVEDCDLDEAIGEVVISLKHDASAGLNCPECGQAMPGYDSRLRRWRHLDTCQYRTIVVCEVPRGKCPEHGVRQIRVPWAEEGGRFTLLFERLVIDWLLESSRSAVARRLGLSWHEVHTLMQRAVRRGLARRRQEVVRRLGVDEKSFQKRHEYVTTVCDLDRGCVLYVGDHRKQETLDAFYQGLSQEQLEGIEAVAMDMWDPYYNSTLEHVPDAEGKIVFDKFHVSQHLNQAVDAIRRWEHKQLTAAKDERLKGTRYDWLKGAASFTRERWQRFADLRRSTLRTARGWALKETFGDFWEYYSSRGAEAFFDRWYGWAVRSRLEPIKKKAHMLKRRLANLLTYARHRITNAMSESLNSKIQWVKYTARGFRNREGFRNAIYFYCGKLDLHPHQP